MLLAHIRCQNAMFSAETSERTGVDAQGYAGLFVGFVYPGNPLQFVLGDAIHGFVAVVRGT